MFLNSWARLIGGLAAFCLCLTMAGRAQTASPASQLEFRGLENRRALDRVLRENALFFNILVSLSITASEADPSWDVDAKDINLNLLSREERDPLGRQLVRARIAGSVRGNNNVELKILDPDGTLVGMGFLGYQSGQLTFYDRIGRAIIDGFVYGSGDYYLRDLRLPDGENQFASGFVDTCFFCSSFTYGWYDRNHVDIGGGGMFFSPNGTHPTRVRMYWSFETGELYDLYPAYGEADYDLKREITGSINSVLFDTERTAASFFAHPMNFLPRSPGTAFFPRLTNGTGLAVTNGARKETEVTFAARCPDGSLIEGEGLVNPITYVLQAGEQFTSYAHEIFQRRRYLLDEGETGWLQVSAEEPDLKVMFLEANADGTGLDGNIGSPVGDSSIIFPHLQVKEGEKTEIDLLNLSHDDAVVRLELIDANGFVLQSEEEYFLAGFGMRHFELGRGSGFLNSGNLASAASLRVSCSDGGHSGYFGCSEIVGLGTFRDRFDSLATAYASGTGSAGPVLIGPHFVKGAAGPGDWNTVVRVAKLEGSRDWVHLDLYGSEGEFINSIEEFVPPGGQAEFSLAQLPELRDEFITGYVRLRSDSGNIAGDVTVEWTDGRGSLLSTYPLDNSLSRNHLFTQVAQGNTGDVEYWTGVGAVNDLGEIVQLTIEIYDPEGGLDRRARISLAPFQQRALLLTELLNEPGYTRRDGYMVVTASAPVSAIVFYGDAGNRFLSAVPGAR